jgi:hypothetical protein
VARTGTGNGSTADNLPEPHETICTLIPDGQPCPSTGPDGPSSSRPGRSSRRLEYCGRDGGVSVCFMISAWIVRVSHRQPVPMRQPRASLVEVSPSSRLTVTRTTRCDDYLIKLAFDAVLVRDQHTTTAR